MTELTRREKLLETRKLTRQLIKLTAQKIVTLAELDLAIEQLLARPDEWAKTDIDAMLKYIKGLPT